MSQMCHNEHPMVWFVTDRCPVCEMAQKISEIYDSISIGLEGIIKTLQESKNAPVAKREVTKQGNVLTFPKVSGEYQ